MDDWLTQFAISAPVMPYVVVFGVLILSGFGLPLPEDIPLILGGYLVGRGLADGWIMFPGAFLCIIGADLIVFTLGRRYGHHIPRLPLLRRYLTPDRVRWAEHKLLLHGGKFIFIARFVPGLRTAAFFAAGVFRVSYWRFIAYDGAAALISVPLILGLAWYFHEELDVIKQRIEQAELWTIISLLVLIVVLIFVKNLFKKQVLSSGQS